MNSWTYGAHKQNWASTPDERVLRQRCTRKRLVGMRQRVLLTSFVWIRTEQIEEKNCLHNCTRKRTSQRSSGLEFSRTEARKTYKIPRQQIKISAIRMRISTWSRQKRWMGMNKRDISASIETADESVSWLRLLVKEVVRHYRRQRTHLGTARLPWHWLLWEDTFLESQVPIPFWSVRIQRSSWWKHRYQMLSNPQLYPE